MEDPIRRLSDLLVDHRERSILVCTGAGISLASGLDTFRGSDPDAVWTTSVLEMGTNAFFESDPVASWRWYLDRFDAALAAEPNDAHRALVAIERWQAGRFLLVTQNVDPLHERAGTEALVKVHGSVDRVRCHRTGCPRGAPCGSLPRPEEPLRAFRDCPTERTLPRCPECGGLLRPHVLWFDETYHDHLDYALPRVWDEMGRMTMALFVGTSFAVGITDMLLGAARSRGIAVLSVDPGASHASTPPGVELLQAPAEKLLPAVAKRIGAESP